jgi:hypothetical protein
VTDRPRPPLIGERLHYILLNVTRNGGGRFGLSSSATQARNSWVESHGEVVKVTGESNTGVALYYLSSAA